MSTGRGTVVIQEKRREEKPQDDISLLVWLKDRLSWDQYLELCSRFGGRRFYLPQWPAQEERNKQIKKEFENILDHAHNPKMAAIYSSLAKRHGLTEGGIRYVLFRS